MRVARERLGVGLYPVEGLHRDVDCRGRSQRVAEPEHGVVYEGELSEVVGQPLNLPVLAGPAGLEETQQEVEGGRKAELELEGVQHQLLHAQDLLLGVGFVRDVDEVPDLRGPDLLVLGGHQHGRHSHLMGTMRHRQHVGTLGSLTRRRAYQLQVLAGDLLCFQETVDDVDCEE